MNLLVPNLGSTSLKYRILEMPGEAVLAQGKLERVTDYGAALERISTAGIPIHAIAPGTGTVVAPTPSTADPITVGRSGWMPASSPPCAATWRPPRCTTPFTWRR